MLFPLPLEKTNSIEELQPHNTKPIPLKVGMQTVLDMSLLMRSLKHARVV